MELHVKLQKVQEYRSDLIKPDMKVGEAYDLPM